MNEGLFSAYGSLPQWQELLEATKTTGCSAVYELAEGERPFLAAALSQRTGRPVVLVCATELVAFLNEEVARTLELEDRQRQIFVQYMLFGKSFENTSVDYYKLYKLKYMA